MPAVTIDRKCGSAQQAMDFAAQGVMAGAYDLVVACGVEMMSRVPMGSNRQGRDHLGPMLRRRYADGLVHQGISAELIAARWGLARGALDAYALRSHCRAAAAEERGVFARDIVPVDGVARDEGIRRDTSAEKLAALEPAFVDAGTAERFPEIWLGGDGREFEPGLRWRLGDAARIGGGGGAAGPDAACRRHPLRRLGRRPSCSC